MEDKKKTAGATLKLVGIDPAKVREITADLFELKNPEIRISDLNGETAISLKAYAQDDLSAKKILKPVVKDIKGRLGELIYSTDENETLEDSVVRLLKENNFTVTAAESCTGGLFTARLINVPGVSDVLKVGFITYSNRAKRKCLGVKRSTLNKYTAVSEQVAKEMSKGACFFTKADCSIAITGIAGPDGGTEKQPVGLVYIGCTVQKKTVAKEYHFTGSRQDIRNDAVTEALALLRLCLLEYYSEVTFGEGKKKK